MDATRTSWRLMKHLVPMYVGCLVVLGTGAAVVLIGAVGAPVIGGRWAMFAALCAVLFVCEIKPIRVVRADGVDDIVASTTFAFAIFLTFGPVPALAVQAFASIIADANARKPAIRAVFNAAQYSISWSAAAAVFFSVEPHAQGVGVGVLTPRWSAAVALAAVAYFACNNALVGIAVALNSGQPVRRTVRATVGSEWTADFVLLALTPIVVIVMETSPAALPLLVLPILVVYRSAMMSAEKQHLAFHDSLTNLPNRVNFAAALRKRIALSDLGTAGILFIDLDRFKEVNDTLGHQAGDELLRMIGPRISSALPDDALVARLGGDEFAVLLPDISGDVTAMATASAIAATLNTPFRLEGFNIEVEASIGIALFPIDGLSDEVLMKRADIAMYVAKSRRSLVERYDPLLDHHTTRRLELVGELRNGIADGDVVLHYQPKLCLDTDEVTEVEALVRWNHPTLGLIPPSEFVPLAEHTGLIRPLTTHVMELATSQAALWRAQGRPISVAVNLSARSLHDGTIVDEVRALLARKALPSRLLRFEITESSIMADPSGARRVLDQLHAMGIRLSIDDFGTGYSSLAYLQNLPVNEIKIDRSFVANVVERAGDQVIVRSTIELARNLGLTSVAEGVETLEVLAWLKNAGCSQVQGYYIAPPMTAGELTEWLQRSSVTRCAGSNELLAVSSSAEHDR